MYNELVSEFVYKFCNDAVESTRDMMCDMPGDHRDYKGTKAVIETSIESFSDSCLDDYLNDFCDMVRKEVAKRRVVVNAITFDDEGFRNALQTIEVKN